jgi:hypothetical protein
MPCFNCCCCCPCLQNVYSFFQTIIGTAVLGIFTGLLIVLALNNCLYGLIDGFAALFGRQLPSEYLIGHTIFNSTEPLDLVDRGYLWIRCYQRLSFATLAFTCCLSAAIAVLLYLFVIFFYRAWKAKRR